jgi:ACS family hexuronate transporter-like MFS transporter
MVAIAAGLTMMVSYVDRTTLAILAPSVTRALGISETGYGALQSAFSVAYLVAVPISGWWVDRAGARRGLVVSVLLWSAVAGLHSLVPGFALLFAARIALGIAEAPGFPGAAQTVTRMLPPAEHSRGFSFLFIGSSVGGMLAAPLASALYGAWGWRVAFLGTAAFGLLWVPVWIVLTRRPDVRAALDAKTARAPAQSGEGTSLRALARHPLMLRALFGILAVAPILGFANGWGAKLLVRNFAVEQSAVGHYLWLPPLGADVGALVFGDLAARQRRAPGAPPRALHAMAALLAASPALLALATTPWEATLCFALAQLGACAVYTLVTSDLLSRMPTERSSFVAGVLTGAQSLALIVANPLIGAGVDAFGGFGRVAVLVGAWVIPCSLVWWAWRPR